jgi:ABC-type antimicrobial peptide transport system permease subunit
VAKQDATMPVDDMEVLQTKLDDRLATERLIAFLSVVFGTLATVLAALGLYGVMAFVIARRTKELGLRMALGAPRATVLWMVLKETAILAALGIAVGVPVAIALSRYASSELFGVKVTDFGTWCGSVVIVGVAAGFAALMPARRASSIDPIRALRYE